MAMKEGKERSWQKRDSDKIDPIRDSIQHQRVHRAGNCSKMQHLELSKIEEQEALAGMSQSSPNVPIWNNHTAERAGKGEGGTEHPLT